MIDINTEGREDSHTIKTKIIAKLARLTAKIILKYNAHYQEFFELFKRELIKESKKQNPGYSMVELSSRIGIDRRYIKKYLNSKDVVIKPSKIKLVLDRMKLTCKINNSKYLKKNGSSQSFESICNDVAPGSLTYNSIAKELVRQGNIIEKGDTYELVEWSFTPEVDDLDQQFRILITEMERLTDTVLYNSITPKTIEKQCQRNIFSSQINPINFRHAKAKFGLILCDTLIKIDEVIGQYEETVPVGTYPEFGTSLFVFGYHSNDNIGRHNTNYIHN